MRKLPSSLGCQISGLFFALNSVAIQAMTPEIGCGKIAAHTRSIAFIAGSPVRGDDPLLFASNIVRFRETFLKPLLSQPLNIVIPGSSRIGKTSLAQIFQLSSWKDDGLVGIFVDFSAFAMEHGDVSKKFRETLVRYFARRALSNPSLYERLQVQAESSDWPAFWAMLHAAEQEAGVKLLIVLDEMSILTDTPIGRALVGHIFSDQTIRKIGIFPNNIRTREAWITLNQFLDANVFRPGANVRKFELAPATYDEVRDTAFLWADANKIEISETLIRRIYDATAGWPCRVYVVCS